VLRKKLGDLQWLEFELLTDIPNLVHGVFDKTYGDIRTPASLKKISQFLNTSSKNIVALNQIHSSLVQVQKVTPFEPNLKADGLITNQKNTFLLLKTADCIPMFAYDPKHHAVSLTHVGWRGAVQKIFLHSLLKMQHHYGTKAKDLLVVLGPSICSNCFSSAQKPLQSDLPEWQSFITQKNSQWHLDIPGFVKASLIDVGIKKNNIETSPLCVAESKDFFSHQRSLNTKEPEGRFASILGFRY